MDDLTRLMQSVSVDEQTGCWEWQKCKDKNGYGVSWSRGKKVSAHRLMYELAVGAIPEGLWVLHTCDNPSCCNPTHLFLGTNQANVNDRQKKKRHYHGERHYKSRLTSEQIDEIRRRHIPNKKGLLIQMAAEFGVKQCTIARIVGGHSRKEG